MHEMLTLEAFEDASEKVREVTRETKLVESPSFSAISGNRVWLKPENMQRTGAYKVRGAYCKISTLSEEELSHGLITASAGNHAQGVAYAAGVCVQVFFELWWLCQQPPRSLKLSVQKAMEPKSFLLAMYTMRRATMRSNLPSAKALRLFIPLTTRW